MDLGGRSHLPLISPAHLCISPPSRGRRVAHFFGVAFFGVARVGDLLARAGDLVRVRVRVRVRVKGKGKG